MVDVLFLCTGNICRSAYAERRAQQLFPGSVIASAGTHAMRGWGVDESLAEVLIERGGTADGFSARQLTEPIAYALTADPLRDARAPRVRPGCVARPRRPDIRHEGIRPGSCGRRRGPRCGARRRRPHGRPALTRRDDIADPYRLGSPEAARTADEIDEVLRAVARTRG